MAALSSSHLGCDSRRFYSETKLHLINWVVWEIHNLWVIINYGCGKSGTVEVWNIQGRASDGNQVKINVCYRRAMHNTCSQTARPHLMGIQYGIY